MAERKSNELLVSAELLAGMLEDGNEIHVRISGGVPAGAILMGVHVEAHDRIVLEFDRDVPETATITDLHAVRAAATARDELARGRGGQTESGQRA